LFVYANYHIVFILLFTFYLEQKLRDGMEKSLISNGDSLSISEPNSLLSKIKSEVAEVDTEFLEAKGTIPKCMLLCFCFPYVLLFSQLHA
jgi:hypothetical protein